MEQLRKDLAAIFDKVRLVPDDVITRIYSYGICEDGQTLMVMLDIEGGGTMFISATPGERLSVSVDHERDPGEDR
jgi:hypothetical protein